MVTAALFDTLPFYGGSNGGCAPRARGEIGMLAEQFASRTFPGLTLTPIQNQVICPDFEWGGLRGEIKSVGAHKQALIYKWRLEKEEKYFDPTKYLYLFIQHSAKIDEPDREKLAAAFANPTPPRIIACTAADVRDAVAGLEARKFSIFSDPNHGSQRGGYKEGGWHLSLNRIALDAESIRSVGWPFGVWPSLFVRIKTSPRFRSATSHLLPPHACPTPDSQ